MSNFGMIESEAANLIQSICHSFASPITRQSYRGHARASKDAHLLDHSRDDRSKSIRTVEYYLY
eukprot:SAG31_NODE_3067_length_4723_cov_8.835063_6_plen_64_part_00